MPNDIIPFDAGGQLPAHLQDLFGDDSNITQKSSINQLSYRGKVWRRIVDGEENVLTKTDADSGEQVPVPIVNVIVLDLNKGRSRSYYKGAYEEGKNQAPDCYSGDGVTPDADVKEPCATTCATCPNSVKGSKITENGKQSTACSAFKRIAIVPAGAKAAASHPPMLLRLAQTSMWDGDNAENEAKGWYAWDQYMDFLRARGAKHTAAIVTKVKFDQRMAYPKLLFSAAGWASAEEAAAAKKRLAEDKDAIAKILSGGGNDGTAGTAPAPAGAAEVGEDTEAQAAVKAALEKAEAEKQTKAAAAEKAKKAAAAKAAKEAEEKAAAEAAKVAASEDDGWGGDDEPAAAPAPKPAAKKAETKKAEPVAEVKETPSALAELLDGWDD